jgi:hypothetical protein
MYGYSGCGTGSSFGGGNCCCNFPTLIILILIVLQFSKEHHGRDNDGKVSKGILFIIALFFLSCCNPCRNNY